MEMGGDDGLVRLNELAFRPCARAALRYASSLARKRPYI